jgi:hypothetical protein
MSFLGRHFYPQLMLELPFSAITIADSKLSHELKKRGGCFSPVVGLLSVPISHAELVII